MHTKPQSVSKRPFFKDLLGFTGFLLGFTGFSLGFTGFYCVLLGFTGLYWVFTMFQLGLLGFCSHTVDLTCSSFTFR